MNKTVVSPIVIILFLSAFIFFSCTERDQQAENQAGDTTRKLEYTAKVMFMKSESDTVSTVDVAIADDNRSRSEGLMNVMNLPDNSGMLFIFENEQTRSFWMANTPLPLDIVFVNSEMDIVRIHRNTQPYSQESIQSEQPAQFVVEVNAGYTIEHDIREGMKIAIEGVTHEALEE